MINHLGWRLSALVDGQLPVDEAEQALAHVAACPGCGDAVAAERAARELMAASARLCAPSDLTEKLRAMGEDHPWNCPAARVAQPRWNAARRTPPVEKVSALPPGPLAEERASRRRRVRLAQRVVGVTGIAVAFGIVGLFVVGGQPGVKPPLVSALDAAANGGVLAGAFAADVGVPSGAGDDAKAPAAGDVEDTLEPVSLEGNVTTAALAWLVEHGLAAPAALPRGYTVKDLRAAVSSSGTVAQLTVSGPKGIIDLVARRGLLDVTGLGGYTVQNMGGQRVFVQSGDLFWGSWQCGETVVSAQSALPRSDVVDVIASFPRVSYDDSPGGRVLRAWETLTS